MNHQEHQKHPIAGVLLIDKPLGQTSMGACAQIRGRLKAGGAPKRVKVGHAGTLDPLATGLLIILVGRATRLCEKFMADQKQYTTTIDLSVTNPTHDLESETTPVMVEKNPSRKQVEQALAPFIGHIQQLPPAHSAMKIGGTRAYQIARRGEVPALTPRPVHIENIEIIRYDWPELSLNITCSKGTYIRSLARDIGAALGTGGVLTALRRTRIGPFRVEDAISVKDLPDPLDPFSIAVPDLEH